MNKNIFDIMNEFTSITSDEFKIIEERLKITTFKRGETFIEIGKMNNILGFLEKGLMRSYFYDKEGNEITTAFIEENSFFSDMNSYQTNSPSERIIEALEDCDVYVLTTEDISLFRKAIKNWPILENEYFQFILKQKVNFQRKLTASNAKESYQLFVDAYGQSAKFAPRQYIASFLGMSPYTLSRIKL